MKKHGVKNKGITLIEVIIYLALFSIIIGGGMVATYQIIQSSDSGTNHVTLEEEANFLLRKINWGLTGATSITTPTTIPTTKLVTMKNISGTATLLTFNFTGQNLTLQRGSGSTVTLNSSSVSISNLAFQKTATGNGINTTFTLSTVENGKNVTENFSTTKYLRQ